MKKILIFLAFSIFLIGCNISNDSSKKTENTIAEETNKENYMLSTDDGDIIISNIYLRQDKTDHGYDGIVAIEFDFSELDEDSQYWFEKNNSYSLHDDVTYENSFKINYITILESEIKDNKKYIFSFISEEKNPIEEMNCALDLSIGKKKIKIREECKNLNIVDEFPYDIKKILDELVLKETGW